MHLLNNAIDLGETDERSNRAVNLQLPAAGAERARLNSPPPDGCHDNVTSRGRVWNALFLAKSNFIAPIETL